MSHEAAVEMSAGGAAIYNPDGDWRLQFRDGPNESLLALMPCVVLFPNDYVWSGQPIRYCRNDRQRLLRLGHKKHSSLISLGACALEEASHHVMRTLRQLDREIHVARNCVVSGQQAASTYGHVSEPSWK